MYFNPPTAKNSSNPFYHPLNEMKFIEEAVTVELDFKSDADGKKAGGKMVRKGVYKMTFKNNAEMNKFLDTHADKLNEEKVEIPANVKKIAKELDDAVALHSSQSQRLKDAGIEDDEDMPKKVRDIPKELDKAVAKHKTQADRLRKSGVSEDTGLEESTPEYRAMMKRYKGSDMEKVFKILDKEGFRMGEQSDTLVRNMLKKHRGNVKKAADQIMKDNPGMFDVNRMMMDHVEIDEEKKLDSRGLGVTRQSGLGSKKVNGEKVKEVLTSAKVPHSMVMGTIRVPERFVRIAKKKLDDAFGGMFQKKTGFKVSGTMKEDVEQINEAYEVTFQFKGSKRKFMSRVKEFQNSGAMTGFSELDKKIEGRPNMVKMTFKSKSDFNKFFSQGVSGGVVKVQENVELDEMSARQHYNKMVAQGKVGRGGRVVTPIDRDRFPNREKEGLEGPFRSRKSGQVYYYDKKAGKYYDPLSDMYLQVKDVMETRVIDNLNDYLAEGTD